MTPEKYIAEVLPKLGGWCTAEKASRLSRIVTESQCSIYLEIGVFAGRSLLAAALSLPAHGIAIGIDPWKRDDSIKGFDDANKDWWGKIDHDQIYDECRANIVKVGVADKCHLIRSNSSEALSLVQRLPFYAVLHIDGNHSEQASCFDVCSYVPRVLSGGTILLDDCDWNTTKRAQSILESMAEKIDTVGNCAIYRKNP